MSRASALLLVGALTGCGQAIGADDNASRLVASPYLATAVGRIDSREEARQLVASADGVIASLLVARGELVRAGQPLLKVDCAPRAAGAYASRAGAEQARAASTTVALGSRPEDIAAMREAARAAQAARDTAAGRLADARGLIDRGFVSRRELSTREQALEQAEAELARSSALAARMVNGPRPSERAEAAAAARAAAGEAGAAQALSAQCTLVSPINGTVLQVLRREGEFSGASQGAVLLVVGDLTQRMVRAEISERDAAQVQPGQAVDVWIEGEAKRWRGRIAQLASVMGRRSARSLDPTDRFDRDSREALIEFDGEAPPAVVGLRVMVGVRK
jgi:multidrug resistance efflux pump